MVVSRCAGIDIGKAEVVVCLVFRVRAVSGNRRCERCGVPVEMNRLADWLAEHRVSHA